MGGADGAGSGQLPNGGNDELKVVDGRSIGSAANGCAERLNIRVRAARNSGQHLNHADFRTEVETGEAGVSQAECAIGHEPVGRTLKGELGRGGAALK